MKYKPNVRSFKIHEFTINRHKKAAGSKIISLCTVKKLNMLDITAIVLFLPSDFHFPDDNF
jgi:hypothetical protein